MNLEVQQSFFNDQQSRFSPETIRGYKIALSQFFSYCPKKVDEVKASGWL
ncbi:hypothetical protein [Cytobacillus sp. Bac17]|nr:hypothetical protein [Cytobacillus sp. Bac17]